MMQPIQEIQNVSAFPVARTGSFADIYRISGNVGFNGSPAFHTFPEHSAVKVFRVNNTGHNKVPPEVVDNMLTDLSQRLSVNAAYIHANIAPAAIVHVMMTTESGPATFKALATPWYSAGDIMTHVKTCPTVNKLILLVETAKALEHLHFHGVVHGAIHPPNILVNDDGHAVIVDAGVHTLISRYIFPWSGHFPVPPSAIYQSPEQLCPPTNALVQPTASMDVYSFATTAWAIFAGTEPFSTFKTERAIVEILHHGHRRLVRPEHMSAELWEILQRCLAADPVFRPTMSEVSATLNGLSL